jgi:hypothetical protein
MSLLPAYWVAINLTLAGIGWILFARSQRGRFHANILPWLSLPFFTVALVYVWFNFFNVDIDMRAVFARLGFLIIAIPQAVILILLYVLNRGDNGQPE